MKVITIGRDNTNDIVINDSKVSRTHCQIIQEDNGNFVLANFSSTNGTFLNSAKVANQTNIQRGDKIRVGNTDFDWERYLIDIPQPQPEKTKNNSEKVTVKTTKSKLWLLVGGVVVLLLLLVGTLVLVTNVGTKKVEATEQTKEEELEKKETEKDNVLKEAQQEKQQALEQARKERQAKEKELNGLLEQTKTASKTEKEKLDKEIAQRQSELNKLNAKEKELTSQVKELQGQIEELKKEVKDANAKAKNANAKAKNAEDDLNAKKKELEEENKLTVQFYEIISDIKDKYLKKACENLKYQIPPKKTAKEVIVEKFKAANTVNKDKIITALKTASGQQTADDKAEATAEKVQSEETKETPKDTEK